jgi:hypothetical protein
VCLLGVVVDRLGRRASPELVFLAIDQSQVLVQTDVHLRKKQFALAVVGQHLLVFDAFDTCRTFIKVKTSVL